jgi:uncharacterized membrane protein
MMVERWQRIAASADLVWMVTSDVERWPTWMPTIRDVTALTPGGMALGSRYRLTQPLQKAAIWEVVRYEPPFVFEWERREHGRLLYVGSHKVETCQGAARAYVALKAFGTASALLRPLFASVIAMECRAMERHCQQIA